VDILLEHQQGLARQRSMLLLRITEAKQAVKQAEKAHADASVCVEKLRGLYEANQKRREDADRKKHSFEQQQRLLDEEKTLASRVADREQKLTSAAAQTSQYDSLSKDLNEVTRSLKEVEEKNGRLTRAVEQKATLAQRCLEEKKDVEAKRLGIRRLGPDASCPTCARELGTQYATLLKHYDETVKQFQTQIASYRKESLALQGEQAALGRQRQALEKKQQYLRGRELEAASVKMQVKNLETELKRERVRLTAIAKEIKGLGSVAFNDRDYLAAVKAAKEAYDQYQKTLGVQSQQRNVLEQRRLQMHNREAELQVLQEQERSLKERIAHQEALQRQVERDMAEKQRLVVLGDFMGRFRTHLISQVRPTLSAYASDLLSQLSDGKYTLLEFDDDYNISVYDNGQSFGIERFSGGEEDLANLCTRLAISEIISERAGSSFNFVILDEIFGSQDSGRRRNILAALEGFSAKFRQIFLVTHIEDIKDSVEHVISIVEGDDGVSTLSVE